MPFTDPDLLSYPVDTDSPDVPRDIKRLAQDTQYALLGGVAFFADDAARDASFAANGFVPFDGEMIFNDEVGGYQRYWGFGQKWVYGWYCGIRRNTDVPLGSNAPYVIEWDAAETIDMPNIEPIPTEVGDPFVMFPVAGVYIIDGSAGFSSGTNNWFNIKFIRARDDGAGGLIEDAIASETVYMTSGSFTFGKTVAFPFAFSDAVVMEVTAGLSATLIDAAFRVTKVANP